MVLIRSCRFAEAKSPYTRALTVATTFPTSTVLDICFHLSVLANQILGHGVYMDPHLDAE